MANRRMFSLDVVDTDKFLEMPLSTQALYFHFGMRADDDGFVSSPKRIIKSLCCNEDDLKLLIAKGYLIPFESGVVVISDWNTIIGFDQIESTTRGLRKKKHFLIERAMYIPCLARCNQLTTN